MAVVSAYIGKTSESGQATMYNVAFRYNGRGLFAERLGSEVSRVLLQGADLQTKR